MIITVETVHISFKASADRREKKKTLITCVWGHLLPSHFSQCCSGESGPESSHEPPHGDRNKIYYPAFPRREHCPLPCLSRIDETQRGEQWKRAWRIVTAILNYRTWAGSREQFKKRNFYTVGEQEGRKIMLLKAQKYNFYGCAVKQHLLWLFRLWWHSSLDKIFAL